MADLALAPAAEWYSESRPKIAGIERGASGLAVA
jgi:hypothetical protein